MVDLCVFLERIKVSMSHFIYMTYCLPSALQTMYAGIPSFAWLYQAPWGSLPACLVGLLLAFLHYELQEAGVKLSDYKVSNCSLVH